MDDNPFFASVQAIAEFWSRVNVGSPDECWTWKSHRWPNGYGLFRIDGRSVGAHRASFFFANGYVPDICRHRCDNPPCVNPLHLLDGDQSANVRDAVERGRHTNSVKTHCKHGHEFTPANTYITARGTRKCRACNAEIMRASYARKRRAA